MDVDSCIDAYICLSDSVFQKVMHRVTLGGKRPKEDSTLQNWSEPSRPSFKARYMTKMRS
jgi:hypothetical protein